MTERQFISALFFLGATVICLPIVALKAFYLQQEREAQQATRRILRVRKIAWVRGETGQVLGTSSSKPQLYPWSQNGPKVLRRGGWGSGASYVICNGDYCWVNYFDESKSDWVWLDDGKPHRLSQSRWWVGDKGKVKPYRGVVHMETGDKNYQQFWPWTEGGPTSAWVSPSNIMSICNREICWMREKTESGPGPWFNGGEPVRLSTDEYWVGPKAKVEPYQGKMWWDNGEETTVNNFYPWTKGGPTAAWTSPGKNGQALASICNREICWIWNYQTKSWGAPGRLSDSEWWNGSKGKVKDYYGIYPWTLGGPTGGTRWREDVIAVFNGSVYWLWDITNQQWMDNGRAYVYRDPNIKPVTVDCLQAFDCNDNNTCTQDVCSNWSCVNPKKKAGTSCGQNKICNQQGQCVVKSTPTPEPECQEHGDCDDGNVCTEDLCRQGKCIFQPASGISCGQGMVCQQGTCVAQATNTPTPRPTNTPTPTPRPTIGEGGGNDQCQGKPRVDINCDGEVNLLDFELWRQRYMETLSQ